MALTKVTGHVVLPTTNIEFHNTKSTGIVTFTHTSNATSPTTGALQVTGGVGIVKDLHVGGNVTVGGTLTYDDVTNIDSIGIITARDGVFLPDNKQVKLGNTAASPDFKIYHNTVANTTSPPNHLYANSNYIDSHGAGNLFIRTAGNYGTYIGNTDGEHAASFHANGSAVFYWDANEKFRTVASGINVTGGASVSGVGTFGSLDISGDIDVDGHTELDNLNVSGVTTFTNSSVNIISTGDANLNLVADTGNNNESSVPTINFTQDGGVNVFKIGVEGQSGGTFTGSTDNTPYLMTTTGHGGTNLDFAVAGALRMKLTATGLQPATNNVEYLGTNATRWARLYTNGIYDGNVKRFGVTNSGFEGYGTQFKFSDVSDINVIINADTDNSDEGHTPNLSFRQDGAVDILNIGVEGVAGDRFAGSSGNFAYVQVGGHANTGLEIATGNTSTKRLTIDTNGNIIPGADSTYSIGGNAVRFANVYADTLYGTWTGGTVTSPVIIDVDGTDDGEHTLLTLDNYVSDLSNEYTWIDFTFRDSNANSTPQVKIGAQVMDDSATGQQGEGAGDFVVKCAVDTASNTMTEMFRCSHDTKITSVHHHPQSHESFDLGTDTSRWRQVYATDFRAPDGNTNGLYAGNSYDLHLFHNGSDSYIENDTGNLTFTNKNNNSIIFKTTSSEAEKLRIRSDGNIGIGNNVADANWKVKLVVPDNASYQNALNVTNNQNSDFNVVIKSNVTAIGNATNNPLVLFTNGSSNERLRINSDGTVTLGQVDSSSSSALHIRSDTNTETTLELSTKGAYNGSLPSAKISFTQQNGTEIARIKCDTNTGAANMADLTFWTNFGGLEERLRITKNGKVGINEPAPNAQLVVRATSDDNPAIQLYRQSGGGDTASINWVSSVGTNAQINYRGGSGSEGLQFRTSTGSGNAGSMKERFRINHGNTQGVQVFVMTESDNSPIDDVTAITIQNGIGGGDIGSTSESTHIDWKWVDSNSNVTPQCRISGHVGDGGDPNSHQKEGKGFLTFHCSNTGNISGVEDPAEVMRLNNLGDLTLNQVTNDTRLGIKQRSSTVDFITCRDTGNTLKFYVHSSGNTYNTNGNYSQISDQSLKENIVDAKSQWNDIKNIKIRNFNFTAASGYETHTQIGCVAQEVETVSPKLVTAPRADGIKTVSNSVLYMKAVKALQEAMTRIETLEAEVSSLKGS